MYDVSSTVKTDKKKVFKHSALSLSSLIQSPCSVIRSDIPVLIFVFFISDEVPKASWIFFYFSCDLPLKIFLGYSN